MCLQLKPCEAGEVKHSGPHARRPNATSRVRSDRLQQAMEALEQGRARVAGLYMKQASAAITHPSVALQTCAMVEANAAWQAIVRAAEVAYGEDATSTALRLLGYGRLIG
jgi:hypothetical protein